MAEINVDLVVFHPNLQISIGQSEDVNWTDIVGPLASKRWQAGNSQKQEIFNVKQKQENVNVQKVGWMPTMILMMVVN
jgi:hypothetical protein